MDLLRHALEPEELADYLSVSRRLAENSRAIPTKVAQGIELGDLLSELTGGLAPRLATAESAATGDRRERNAAELPWVHKASPKAILQDLERLQWYNDRIIAFTSQMVMKHSVAGQLLATQKLAALSVMERQEQEPGKSLMTFVRRLKGAGLKAEAVKDMPNAVIAALAATLNGEMANDLSDALGIAKSERDREDAGEPEDDLDVLQKQAAALKAEIDGFSAYRNLQALVPDEPPVHLQPDEWNYEHGDLPRELWSVIFEPIQYRFEDRPATAEQCQSASKKDPL
ncbi:hypothetical protein DC429_16850 [Arthrobacter sp. TPD3018]|nr:hypothetical protein DC429_16850 [Arthrobacter sp. TPD3018]PVE54356.1 hypothetical protein DC425_11665 [Sphingomonas sp. TPD3009]PVE82825.1 hypothetical protein DC431_13030 [Sphingomonas melonis]